MDEGQPRPILLCSIPKSGTYFFAAILEHMGRRNCGVHLGPADHHVDYGKCNTLKEARTNHLAYRVTRPTADIIGEMDSREFACSHTGPFLRASCVRPVHIVTTQRNLRSCVVSHCRWVRATGRWEGGSLRGLDGRQLVAECCRRTGKDFAYAVWPAAAWLVVPHDLALVFEAFSGEGGREAQLQGYTALAHYLGWDGDIGEAIEATSGADTMTWSGKLTDWEAYWSTEAELYFEGAGLKLINHFMGYE